jgi:cell shape-determining protein MreC
LKAEKIERKVQSMKKYEHFLEKVREANPDEFAELIDILSRYKQLVAKNEELKKKQDEYNEEHERISRELSQFEN